MSIYYKNGISAKVTRRWNLFAHSLYIDCDADTAKSVFICGAGRSGTTWLAEILNAQNEYRYLYEPFNREQVAASRCFGLRQYLRPTDENVQHLSVAQSIFSGRIRSGWIDQYNRSLFPQRRMIKDVRSTLMLKWIRDHFPEMKIIFVIRHPCAVAASKVRLGWRIDLANTFLGQDQLVADHIAPFRQVIGDARTEFEQHIIAWCIENFVPLQQLSKGDVYFAPYENLCVNPSAELKSLFTFLERPFGSSVLTRLDRLSASTPKAATSNGSASTRNAANAWRKQISTDQLAYAQAVVKTFGLDQIYDESLQVSIANLQKCLGGSAREPMA